MDLCLGLWSRAQAFVVALFDLHLWLIVMLLLHLQIWSLHGSIMKDRVSNVVEEILEGAYLVVHTGRYYTPGSSEGKDTVYRRKIPE